MAIERRNPLPAGRYWVDVPASKLPAFQSWLTAHSGEVITRQTEESPETAWYLFDVKAPVPWEGPGFPTIAGDVQGKDDTANGARTEGEIRDEMIDELPKVSLGVGGVAVGILGTLGLLYFLKGK